MLSTSVPPFTVTIPAEVALEPRVTVCAASASVNVSTLVTVVKSSSTTVDASVTLSTSVPLPPDTVSSPVNRADVVEKISLPAPPVRMSLPPSPLIVSAPLPPVIVSAPSPPVRMSSPAPPVIVKVVVATATADALTVRSSSASVITEPSTVTV